MRPIKTLVYLYLTGTFKLTAEFTKILLLSEAHKRPIGDLLETNMPDRRRTCLRDLIGILIHHTYFLLIYIYWNNILE